MIPENYSIQNSRQLSASRESEPQQPGVQLCASLGKFLHCASPNANYGFPQVSPKGLILSEMGCKQHFHDNLEASG